MTSRQGSVRVAVAAVVLDAVGAVVAQRKGLVGEPFGVTFPFAGPPGVELVVWGSATSAPAVMDAAALYLAGRSQRHSADPRDAKLMTALGLCRLVGVTCEPATWGRRPSKLATMMAPCHAALAASQIALGLRAGRTNHAR